MMTRAPRLLLVVCVVAVGLVAVIGAAAVGAASAPPVPMPPVTTADPGGTAAEPGDEPPAPKRFSVIGVIVAKREQGFAVRVEGRERPVLVAVRPTTVLRLNHKPATLADYQIGDRVVVVGRTGPLGNAMVARGANVVKGSE